jgi:hypothetical protein
MINRDRSDNVGKFVFYTNHCLIIFSNHHCDRGEFAICTLTNCAMPIKGWILSQSQGYFIFSPLPPKNLLPVDLEIF